MLVVTVVYTGLEWPYITIIHPGYWNGDMDREKDTITNELEYQIALTETWSLMDTTDTEEESRLVYLARLIEAYEEEFIMK